MIVDTDTNNEIDDQFALAYALLSPEKISVEAIYAGPFVNSRARTAAEGMEQSYEEAHRVLGLLGIEKRGHVLRGSKSFMQGPDRPVKSPAAEDLIERVMTSGGENLYVVALGAPTNVSSALVLEPKLTERVTVVWRSPQSQTRLAPQQQHGALFTCGRQAHRPAYRCPRGFSGSMRPDPALAMANFRRRPQSRLRLKESADSLPTPSGLRNAGAARVSKRLLPRINRHYSVGDRDRAVAARRSIAGAASTKN